MAYCGNYCSFLKSYSNDEWKFLRKWKIAWNATSAVSSTLTCLTTFKGRFHKKEKYLRGQHMRVQTRADGASYNYYRMNMRMKLPVACKSAITIRIKSLINQLLDDIQCPLQKSLSGRQSWVTVVLCIVDVQGLWCYASWSGWQYFSKSIIGIPHPGDFWGFPLQYWTSKEKSSLLNDLLGKRLAVWKMTGRHKSIFQSFLSLGLDASKKIFNVAESHVTKNNVYHFEQFKELNVNCIDCS